MKIRVSNCHGGVLLISLGICMIVGTTLASYMAWGNHQNRMVMRSEAWNAAMPVLEAGLEEALSHLKENPAQRTKDGWPITQGFHTKTRYLGSNYFTVRISTNAFPVITATGYVPEPISKNRYISRTVRITTTNNPLFSVAIAVKQELELNGNTVLVDSYDSTNPNFSTNGQYTVSRRKDGGDVATQLGIRDALGIGNANVYGRAFTAPGGTVRVGSNGAVGSKTWNETGKVGVEPGWHFDDMNIYFPPIKSPPGGVTPLGGKIGSKTYDYILGDGDYLVSQLTGSIYVTGNATLSVMAKFQVGSGDALVLAPGATIKFYVYAATAKIGSGWLPTGNISTSAIQYYGMPANKELDFTGGSVFTGVIYAPDTDVMMGGGGGTPVNVQGALMAKSLKMTGRFNFHFDEALRSIFSNGLVVASWNEL